MSESTEEILCKKIDRLTAERDELAKKLSFFNNESDAEIIRLKAELGETKESLFRERKELGEAKETIAYKNAIDEARQFRIDKLQAELAKAKETIEDLSDPATLKSIVDGKLAIENERLTAELNQLKAEKDTWNTQDAVAYTHFQGVCDERDKLKAELEEVRKPTLYDGLCKAIIARILDDKLSESCCEPSGDILLRLETIIRHWNNSTLLVRRLVEALKGQVGPWRSAIRLLREEGYNKETLKGKEGALKIVEEALSLAKKSGGVDEVKQRLKGE